MGEYAEMSMDTWDIDEQIDFMYWSRSVYQKRREQWHDSIKPSLRYIIVALLAGRR